GNQVLEEVLFFAVRVERAGEGGAKADDVGAAVGSVDAVDVGVEVFGVFVGVLPGDFDLHVLGLGLVINDPGMDRFAGPVEVLHVFDDAPLVAVFLGGVDPLVDEPDAD